MVDRHMIKDRGLTWLERLGIIGLIFIVAPFFVLGVIKGVGDQFETIETMGQELQEKKKELEYLKDQVQDVQRAITGAEDLQMLQSAPLEEILE